MKDRLKRGWHSVTTLTGLRIDNYGNPIAVRTTRYDLDAALDDAAEYFGGPIKRLSPWLTDDGRDPERVDTGDHSLVTCNVREDDVHAE